MPAEPAINIVADAMEAIDLAQNVAALSNRAAGRVVFHPAPGTTSATDFAADILTSLGKRFDALRFERATKQAWQLVDIWFQAEQVRDLFVLRAARLDPALLRSLTDLAIGHGAAVWHIGGPGGGHRHDVRRWNKATFRHHWMEVVAVAGSTEEGADFPEVPDDDFLTFRWSCRRLLDSQSFERVDRAFCESMDITGEWLRPRTRFRCWGAPDGEPPDGDEFAAQLQELLVSASSAAEALTRLRGAQAAYFRAGWLIDYPISDGGESDGLVPLGPALDETMARRLRRLCLPASTAAMALVLATDLRSDGLSRLDISDVDEDGGGVLIGDGGHRFTVPPHAQSLVRALLVERRIAGAGDRDALFMDARRGERITAERMSTLLRRLCWSTTAAVGLLAAERSPMRPSHWLLERRLGIRSLHPDDVMGE